MAHDAFDRGSLMVWGRMSLDGCVDLYVLQRGHINVQRYGDDLLESIVTLLLTFAFLSSVATTLTIPSLCICPISALILSSSFPYLT